MKQKNTLWRLTAYCFKHKISYTFLFITMFVGIGLDLGTAWYLNKITDAAVTQTQTHWPLLIIIGLIILFLTVANIYLDTYLKSKVSSQIRKNIRIDTLKKVLCLPASHFNENHSGELLTRMTNDNQAIGTACSNTILSLIRNPILAVSSFIYLMTINWKLALICALVGPMTLLVGGLFGKVLRHNSQQLQSRIGTLTSVLQEILNSSTIFKTFGLEKKLLTKFILNSEDISKFEIRGGKIQASLSATANAVGLLSFIVTFIVGAYFAASGSMTVGGLIAFIQLMNHLTWPFSGLASSWGELQQALGAADRIFKTMDEKAEFHEIPAHKMNHAFNKIEVAGLTFGYNTERLILNDVSINVEAGQKIALVGPSGGGKTTIFKMLLGLFEPDKGHIQINEKNVREMELQDLRGYFSFVPQESFMYSGTIRENIAFGKLDASEEEITAAARDANALGFISELPDGLDTHIGEGGGRLSGGQKQRLSIARALLRNAPVLLLDEATAALDNESERLVQEALDRLMAGRTTFIIAHRLSTVQHADQIIVIENGTVADKGKHEELLQSKGLYYRLYNSHLLAASTIEASA
ncbi:ABC transporter ATP-binding protein [Paenibacillus radicis (ex Gao et al. 2016)]|uniref:ABC transporter ATP-binding protein n=1 Tax=Paenibacillus radicis (ex Gao et al. 2016) TaxID=1737354 RepID=A0A917M8D7_9BACL|nr:ABC transporter ATP-binding protein [Paenibacillus radicis (ex Gao et al. 2016)]GGG85723.1 ABC transporter ATP-binding protein [Paenibacillus radicis (ex Gao et al. 2016)]